MPDIAIAHHEWMALCHLVHAIDPSESDPAEGVALMRRQGRRWWTVWDRGAAVHTTAVSDTERPRPEHEVTLVSPRVVYHAVAMGGSADPVHLRLDDGSVGLSGQRGALTVTRPVERPVASDRRVTAVESTATVPAGDLRAVLAGAVYRPRGVVADRTGPWLSLEVAEGRLVVAANWTDLGAPSTRFEIPARTYGTSRPIAPAVVAVEQLLRDVDDDVAVGLTVPESRDALEVDTPEWWLRSNAADLGPGRWRRRVVQALEAADLAAHGGDDMWLVQVAEHSMALHLVDDEPTLVRASAMLVDGIEDRADVLAEVNALTGALPGTRVWFDSGVVFAGFDLPGSAVEEHLAPMLVNLGRRVNELRPLLAALGARQPTNYDQGVLF